MENLSSRVDPAGDGAFDYEFGALAKVIGTPATEIGVLQPFVPSLAEELVDDNVGDRTLGVAGTVADAAGLVFAMVVAAVAEGGLHGAGSVSAVGWSLARVAVCLPVLVLVLAPSRHRLRLRLGTTVASQIREVTPALAGATLGCITAWRVASGVTGTPLPPEDAMLVTFVLGLLAVSVVRAHRHAPSKRDGVRARRVLLVGSGVVAGRVGAHLEATYDVKLVGCVDDEPLGELGWLGTLADLPAVCVRNAVEHVVVAFSRSPDEKIVEALRALQGRLPISVVPRLFEILPDTAGAHDLASGYPAISVAPATLGWWPRAVKRAIDVAGAALGLTLSLPLLVVAAIGVRLSSAGPVFLRQFRVGRNGREFEVWKLRTLVTVPGAPGQIPLEGEQVTGPFPKLKSDPRATPFGRVLRRLSIDELPQLWNVLRGEMSLVGPRPFVPHESSVINGWAGRRYSVRPGLTGLWQVSGRNDLTYEEMCRLDHLYVTCWSVALDVAILARTARAVLGGRGCY